VALGVAACAAPAPDPNGAIECGPAGECPSDFACRFGRCCPGSSSYDQCPTPQFTPDEGTDGSAYACDAAGRCPSGHDYVCRFGRCCPSSGGTGMCNPRAVGNPCSSNSDCGVSGGGSAVSVCFQNLGDNHVPGGYCSALECTDLASASCGINGHCFVLSTLLTLCAAECEFPPNAPYAPCRFDGVGTGSYSCFPALGESATAHVGICLPDCTRDPTLCANGTMCDPVSHLCDRGCHVDTDCTPPAGAHAHCVAGVCQIAAM
jgi:hypothetical protein